MGLFFREVMRIRMLKEIRANSITVSRQLGM
jgi:hypothetical protein